MIKGKILAVLLVLSLTASAASYVGGRWHQINIQYVQDLKDEVDGFERAIELENQLVAKEEELEEQRLRLEELARATPPTNTCIPGNNLPASRVRRLNELR